MYPYIATPLAFVRATSPSIATSRTCALLSAACGGYGGMAQHSSRVAQPGNVNAATRLALAAAALHADFMTPSFQKLLKNRRILKLCQ
jgi:hypothetical protein